MKNSIFPTQETSLRFVMFCHNWNYLVNEL